VPDSLSRDFIAAATAERDALVVRLIDAQARIDDFEALAAEAREETESFAASIRAIEEVAGLAPQMALCEVSEELRRERLREVALEVLRRPNRPEQQLPCRTSLHCFSRQTRHTFSAQT